MERSIDDADVISKIFQARSGKKYSSTGITAVESRAPRDADADALRLSATPQTLKPPMRLLVIVCCATAAAAARGTTESATPRSLGVGGTTESATPRSLGVGGRLAAGGTARAVSQLALFPVDALRTHAQTRAGAPTLRELGVRRLVSGAGTTSAFAYGIGALQFAGYGLAAPRLGPLAASVCGAVASCVVSVPQELLKQRLVTGIYPSFRVAVATIWRADGVRGFYTAWLPTVSRNVPFVVCTFTTFAALERRRLRARGGAPLGPVDSLQLGVTSALIAGVLTQPVDVVKTRLMTQAASSLPAYASAKDCVLTMLRTEGPASFYAGLRQRMAYAGPLWAIQFLLNAQLSRALLERQAAAREAGG